MAEDRKKDAEDGRKTYLEIWRRRLTEPYESPGFCTQCCGESCQQYLDKADESAFVLRHSLAMMLTEVTWQISIIFLVLIEVLINLVLMLIEFHAIEDETHIARHLLHFVGISILAIFVLEVFLKFFALGCEYFLKEKLEMFDAFVIVAAFIIEIVLSVMRAKKAWKGFTFIIVLRLWRVVRLIINIVAFKEEFYELIEDTEDAPKPDSETKTEELSQERQTPQ